jgi:N-acetylglucosaminyl-diphospho-decaprenol L-rhamnosyltransferase
MIDHAPDVSVVVVNFNGRAWIDRCLAAVLRQESLRLEVIFVDNGSSDGSAPYVEQRFPEVRVLRLDRNLGFAAGNNAGARLAIGRLLAFLNNDTEADPAWAATLKGALDARPDAGLATSRIVFLHDPAVVDSAGDGYLRAGGAYKRGHGQRSDRFVESGDVFGACGAAFMIRRDVFDDLGGFDEDFFLVYEDVDLSYRAQLRDSRCVYVPGALVRHAGSRTIGLGSRLAVFHGQRNLEWVYWKNTPWPILWLTLPGHILYSLAGGAHCASVSQLGTWCAAKSKAVAGLGAVWRKRRAVQRGRRTSLGRLWRLMDRGWLMLKRREKRFDRESGAAR